MRNDFREELAGRICAATDLDAKASTALASEIMGKVRNAIANAGVSHEIDTWIVRAELGREGTRRDENVARAFGKGEDPETRALVDLYARIYALERQAGGSPADASKAAACACGTFGLPVPIMVSAEEKIRGA